MPEIRTDPIGGRKVVIADDRAGRPGAFAQVAQRAAIDPEADPFLEGHEDRTPPELWALRPGGGEPDTPGWLVRSVPNLYPALRQDAAPAAGDPEPELFAARAAEGHHEVIVNSPLPIDSLSDIDPDGVAAMIDGWRSRIAAHSHLPYCHLFVNEGREAGASLPHTHAQLAALPFVPAAVAREREAFTAHAARSGGRNLLSDIVAAEVRRRDRLVAVDDDSVLIAPWASQAPFQLMIVPRDSAAAFDAGGQSAVAMLMRSLRLLRSRFGGPPPMNLWVRQRPAGAEHWTWRIDILPRLAQPAGMELGTDLGVNPVAPERAAAELRELDR